MIYSIIINLYESFIKGLTNNKDFKIDIKEKDDKAINSFISKLSKEYRIESVGENLLKSYFAFQLDYWHDKDTMFGKNIQLNWIIGEKAWQRWLEKREGVMYFANKASSKYNLTLSKKKNEYSMSNSMNLIPYEELTRSGRNLKDCYEGGTTLYHPNSEYCGECKFKKDCAKILKKKYKNIFLARGMFKRMKEL